MKNNELSIYGLSPEEEMIGNVYPDFEERKTISEENKKLRSDLIDFLEERREPEFDYPDHIMVGHNNYIERLISEILSVRTMYHNKLF